MHVVYDCLRARIISQAMDAIQQFADCGYCDTYTDWRSKSQGQPSPVTQFVVGGASKRGWTTWTTGPSHCTFASPTHSFIQT